MILIRGQRSGKKQKLKCQLPHRIPNQIWMEFDMLLGCAYLIYLVFIISHLISIEGRGSYAGDLNKKQKKAQMAWVWTFYRYDFFQTCSDGTALYILTPVSVILNFIQ